MSLTEPTKDVRGTPPGAVRRGGRRKGAAGEPAERVRFESLLVELSAAFVNLPAPQVDAEITRWLQCIVEFLDIDRSVLVQFDDDAGDLRVTHSWTRPGCPPVPALIPREAAPWLVAKVLADEVVVIPRLDDLPPEAARDKETAARIGTKANVTLPLTVGGSVIGAMTFGSIRRERSWPEDLVKRFRLVGQVFANALMRKRAHEELERVHRFQDLVAQLSSSFVNVPADQVDAEISRWQERIVAFLGIDRSTVARISEDGSGFHVTHSSAAPGFSPVPSDIPRKEIPWVLRALLGGEMVKLACLDDLPTEAWRDKETLRRIGQKSTLIIPLLVGGSVIGLAAFGTLRRERSWPPELVRRLQLVGQVFTNALMRKRAQEQIDELLGFEQLLLQLSAAFINLPVEEIGREIARGLQQSAEFLRVDRATVYESSDQHGICIAIHAYAAPGVQLAPAVVRREEFPWLFERLLLGEPFVMATPRDLAAEAQGERRYVQEHGIQSSIAVPLRAGGTVRGFVGWAATRAGREWPDALVQWLRLVGEIFSGALQRQRAEEEATHLRYQLARAARVTMMGELAAAIAHEVNQPLCAIVRNAQAARRMLAADAPDIAELREALQDILQDGKRGSAVLARIRRFLQRAPVQGAPVDINELIREVAALTRTEMARRRVVVKLRLAEALPPVLGDRVQLEQVVLNLLANGADAMDAVEHASRDLVIRSSANGTAEVAVAVTDAGVGLDPASLDRLFEPFFTTKPGGMGMGLAISKSIIEAHGGRLWAGPNGGRGATFQFSLPAIKA